MIDAGRPWIGVDLDGTLAHYNGWVHHTDIGAPIPAMVNRVRRWLAEGKDVRIVTARANDHGTRYVESITAIVNWCKTQFGKPLPVTCQKDVHMLELWDARARQVEPNTGVSLEEELERAEEYIELLEDKLKEDYDS